MARNPQAVLQKYQQGVANAGQAYRDGVQNPSRSWLAGYQGAQDRMVQGLQRAVAEGRPIASAQRLGDAGYREKTMAKADRYAAAAPLAAQGYAAVVDKVIAAATAGQNAAAQIEPTTWEARKRRMVANAEAISRAWGKSLT